MSNPVAEIMDVFFNGRPAPKDVQIVRISLTKKQRLELENGSTLRFKAGSIWIQIGPHKTK